jgi:hypothetical protein
MTSRYQILNKHSLLRFRCGIALRNLILAKQINDSIYLISNNYSEVDNEAEENKHCAKDSGQSTSAIIT